ncbi:AAA family ATPase [Patescibacteria group bacterium]|nr:AAA family ATPase [Patescibacteria group bacterium]
MYLESLKLNGFKSFARPTVLEFPHSASAIVGPNGSGKSNVVEAIAWVLGEQSVKNLRGKKGEDLIFRGSSPLIKKNRASVRLSFGGLAKDKSGKILISRVVYKDGSNEYWLNNSRCKLKDINEFLVKEGIVTSKYHIVSQSEADKIFNTSAIDKRKIIEDALGLKIFQLKKEESERKLKKAEENMVQVEALRREIKPHLNFLKKQFDKAQKLVGFRAQLKDACLVHFAHICSHFEEESKKINIKKNQTEKEILEIEEKIKTKRNYLKKLEQKRGESQKIREKINFFEREIGRQEGALFQLRDASSKNTKKEKVLFVSVEKIRDFMNFLEERIDSILEGKDISMAKKILNEIKEKASCILEKEEKKELEEERGGGGDGIRAREIEDKIKKLLASLKSAQKEDFLLKEDNEKLRKNEMELYRLEGELSDKKREKITLAEKMSAMDMKKERITKDKEEVEKILNEKIETKNMVKLDKKVSNDFDWQEKQWREIERIKIKIEEGSNIGNDIIKEYEEVRSRDDFLSHQIADLRETVISLEELIEQLKEKLDVDFKEGILKISAKFQEFFVLMFGGGEASLRLRAPRRRLVEKEIEEDGCCLEEIDEGVDLFVKLPQKGNCSLNMLSGGEKALTSIALLFAMSQINPPPFLVLDETDAALDESNSRRYARMLKSLSKDTQLILITHNRETMNAVDVLYGVTMDNNSISRILSVKLEEAEKLVATP